MRLVLSLLILFFSTGLFAQKTTLWGQSSVRSNSGGSIFSFEEDGANPNLSYLYERSVSSFYTSGKFLEAQNGRLYAFSEGSGSNSRIVGTIFELDPVSGTQRTISNLSFIGQSSINNAHHPQGSFIQATNGKLYGLTSIGSNRNRGAIVSYDFIADTLTIEKEFGQLNIGVSSPSGSFVEASNGKLYALSFNGNGTIFEYDINLDSVIVVHQLTGGSEGRSPVGTLIEVGVGKLYGLTTSGGVNDKGVVFEYDFINDVFTKKVDLGGANSGDFPQNGLVEASNGMLYATAITGGNNDDGVVFEYNPNTDSLRVVTHLDSATLGSSPTGSVLESNNGFLYLTCRQGGFENDGTIVKINLQNDSASLVHAFNQRDGQFPRGTLMQASDGNLYGFTTEGGILDAGTTFRIQMPSEQHQRLNDGDWYNNGYAMNGGFIQGKDGWLYGTTFDGGINASGVLYRINPYKKQITRGESNGLSTYDPHLYERLHDFDTLDGFRPYGALTQLPGNVLIGSTPQGGLNGDGTIFTFDYAKNTFEKVYDFDSAMIGRIPNGSFVFADDGFVYGTTEKGGALEYGAIFRFDIQNRLCINVLELDSVNGERFDFGVMQASNGLIYGLASNGGAANKGTILAYDPTNGNGMKIADFGGMLGENPVGELIEVSGKLYGMAPLGGATNNGVLFSYDITNDTLQVEHHFSGFDGREPRGKLSFLKGKLYGITQAGGSFDRGTSFSFDLSNGQLVSIVNFFDDFVITEGPRNGLTVIDSCQHPFLASLTYPTQRVCMGDTLRINVGSNSSLNGASRWDLYNDIGTNAIPIDTSISGFFELAIPMGSKYYIGASGGCAGAVILDSISIQYHPSSITADTVEICSGDDFQFDDGITFFDIRQDSNRVFSIPSVVTGCDSIISIQMYLIRLDTSVTVIQPTLLSNDTLASYQWLDCDNNLSPISGATNRLFEPIEDGNYAVEIKRNNCIDTSACRRVVGVGLADNLLKSQIQISPNPIDDFFVLTIDGPYSGLQMTIRDIQGRIIMESNLIENKKRIDFDALPGIYFIQLEDGDGKRANFKVTKQ